MENNPSCVPWSEKIRNEGLWETVNQEPVAAEASGVGLATPSGNPLPTSPGRL